MSIFCANHTKTWYYNSREREVNKMSILQEYERFKQSVGEHEWDLMTAFLDQHGEYMLSDLLYSMEVYKEYEEWKNHL
jgi:hypothetical protein